MKRERYNDNKCKRTKRKINDIFLPISDRPSQIWSCLSTLDYVN